MEADIVQPLCEEDKKMNFYHPTGIPTLLKKSWFVQLVEKKQIIWILIEQSYNFPDCHSHNQKIKMKQEKKGIFQPFFCWFHAYLCSWLRSAKFIFVKMWFWKHILARQDQVLHRVERDPQSQTSFGNLAKNP